MLATVEDEFNVLLAAVDGLTDEQMTRPWYGTWCVRDILAHIAGWHREMTGALERISRGERATPEGVDYSNEDAWNKRFAEAWWDAGPAEVLAELVASKGAFVGAARQVPEDWFEEGRSANRIINTAGIDHYREHAPPIREWRQREGI